MAARNRALTTERKIELQTQPGEFGTGTKGLRIRVGTTGLKTWVTYFRDPTTGKVAKARLGHWPELSLDEAIAAQLKAKAERRKGAVRAQNALPDCETLCQRFYAAAIEPHRIDTGRVWHVIEKDVLPAIGRYRPDKVTLANLEAIVEARIARGQHGAAREALKTLKALFSWAKRRRFVQEDISADMKASDLGLARYVPRRRRLEDEELAEMLRELTAWPDISPAFRCAIKLLVLTGLRSGEVVRNEWANVDMETRTLAVPASLRKLSKAKKAVAEPHVTPLSNEACVVLREWRDFTDGRGWLLPTRGGGDGPCDRRSIGRACSRLQARINRQRTELGLVPRESWSPHDLRRTMASGLGELGVPRDLVDALLDHAPPMVSGIYNRAIRLQERRDALEAWGAHVARLK